MLVVVVLSCVLVDSLLLSLPIEPVTLHGDTSESTIAAGIHLQPPKLFNFQTPYEWPYWRKRFEQFRIASGLGSKSEDQHINTLLYCLGEESNDILTSTGVIDEERKSYKDVLRKFDSFLKYAEMLFLNGHCLTDNIKMRERLQSNTLRRCTTSPAIATTAKCKTR